LPAFVILQTSTGPPPAQEFADRPRDLCHSQAREFRRDLAHKGQFVAAECAAAKGH
jgi:hypothetical protein